MYSIVIYRPNNLASVHYAKSYTIKKDGTLTIVTLSGKGRIITYEPECGEELEIREHKANGYKVVFGGCWLNMPFKLCTEAERNGYTFHRGMQLPVFHGKGWELTYDTSTD